MRYWIAKRTIRLSGAIYWWAYGVLADRDVKELLGDKPDASLAVTKVPLHEIYRRKQ